MISEANRTNIHARHSNKSLHRSAVIQAVVTITFFCIGVPVLYSGLAWALGDGPNGIVSILLFPLGLGIGTAIFFPSHFRYAKKKRADFISAGGDPTGITPFMFGAMGGHLLKDGTWEWYGRESSGGDGGVNSIGDNGDSGGGGGDGGGGGGD